MKMIMIPWVFLQTLRKIQTCPLNELMMSIENNSIVPDSHFKLEGVLNTHSSHILDL